MIDVLFYAPDAEAVIPDLMKTLPAALVFDENGNPTGYSVSRTPARRKTNAAASLTLARLTDEEWALFQGANTNSLEVLASGTDPIGKVLSGNDAEALAKYREVWPETWQYNDPDTGHQVTVRNPDRFYVFSGDKF